MNDHREVCSGNVHLQDFFEEDERAEHLCRICKRARCTRLTQGRRCRKFPCAGISVCPTHGGAGPIPGRATQRHRLIEKARGSAFWNPDEDVLDPSVTMLKIASRLYRTTEVMGDRLDVQLDEWTERVENRDGEGDCECCGLDPVPPNPFTEQILDTWKFCIKETNSLLGSIQKIGLAERALRLQEGQVQLLIIGMSAIFETLELTEVQQLRARDAAISAMMALEESPGVLDSKNSALEVLVEPEDGWLE